MSTPVVKVKLISTKPYQDQKPGTSGLRKKCQHVLGNPNYIENFVQSTLDSLHQINGQDSIKSLVVGGDGRYLNIKYIQKIVNICSANKIEKLYLAKGGLMSTPTGSAVIRKFKASGGFILTASHNEGGPNGDFGIKFNDQRGAPANEQLTGKIHEFTQKITEYKTLEHDLDESIDSFKVYISDKDQYQVNITRFDAVQEYLQMAESLFDLESISCGKLIAADSMNGVMVPYVKSLLIDKLNMIESHHVHSSQAEDFGGLHPDPHQCNIDDLKSVLLKNPGLEFAVAFDGDGDRNLVLGQNAFYIPPSDSLAIFANNADHIPLKITGVARSMPTAPSVDRVAAKKGFKVYETPTGWKFFCNLFDEGLISLCGEESYGLGSNHIREKDGMWACLAWLTIISKRKMSLIELARELWEEYGRDYTLRHDYSCVDSTTAAKVIENLKNLDGKQFGKYTVEKADVFEFVDPVTKEMSKNQGYRIIMTNGARIVVRLSGTGSSGETIRMYFNEYSKEDIFKDAKEFLKDLVDAGNAITHVATLVGREEPDVVT